MNKRVFMLACVLSASTNAAILPDAIDLKAAYCISIVRSSAEIGGNIENMPEPFKTEARIFREKAQSDLRRLQLYLVPRIKLLDPMPLLGADQSAQDDQARSLSEVQSCMGKPQSELKACLEVETEAQKRIRSCRDLSFLPF
jgi:hypothetical protein